MTGVKTEQSPSGRKISHAQLHVRHRHPKTACRRSRTQWSSQRSTSLRKCGFYETLAEGTSTSFKSRASRFLRYGPPIHTTWLGEGNYDWSFCDETLADLKRRDIVPILDLCHFGVPDWVGDFQNPDFPKLFERYAGDFAARYPWIQLYTPVNEMFICATFSARWGWWNEQLSTDTAFITALKHLVKANILAMYAILDIRPDALFIQSESSEYFHPESPGAIGPADAFNEQRFLSLDLNYGHDVSGRMMEFLRDCGMTIDEYKFFRTKNLRHHCIIGNDYYHHQRASGARRWPDRPFRRDLWLSHNHAGIFPSATDCPSCTRKPT